MSNESAQRRNCSPPSAARTRADAQPLSATSAAPCPHLCMKTGLADESHLHYRDTQLLLLPHTRFSLLIGHYEPLKRNLMQVSKETNTKRRGKGQN